MRHLALFLLLVPTLAAADEGMWTFDNFPAQKVKDAYGFAPDAAWLAHVRESSVRLAGGCSGSFVSADGLVLTNQHCVRGCVEQLSTAQENLMERGFVAKALADERRCPEVELNTLVEITDVTDRMTRATAKLTGKAFNDAEQAEQARVEKECAKSDKERCDVVSLYHGGRYHLYRYRRFQDVRLVMSPELDAAKFGGDPDNFNFPRYGLDVGFLRAWDDGKPAKVPHHLTWSKAGPKENALVFVSGHPGGTERLSTIAQLVEQRDVELPEYLMRLAELRGLLGEVRRRGPEERRVLTSELLSIENGFKALKGRREALVDVAFFGLKVAEEEAFRAKLKADPAKAKYLAAFDEVAKADQKWRALRKPLLYLEGTGFAHAPSSVNPRGFGGDLFVYARTLLRAAAERPKPQDVRLREFRDAALPTLTQKLFSPKPISDVREVTLLSFGLVKLREDLGADDPAVKKVLGKRSPEQVAEAAVKGTALKDPAVRKRLWEGGQKALDALKDDPMLALARSVDADARAVRKEYEAGVEAVEKEGEAALARARFEVYGTSTYPDATFTLRLSYGVVKGWEENGKQVPPFTTFGGAFERNTGAEPFALPKSWLAAKEKLDLKTPFDLVTTNDIIGGNSGSPVIDQNGNVVGLIFDGNLHSLGGRYGFDPAKNRAVAVDTAAITEALAKIYGANRLLAELE